MPSGPALFAYLIVYGVLYSLPNAAMKWFNEPSLGSWAFRDRRKLLVIDSETAFVGGCNIAEDYNGDGVTRGWRDGGLRIDGPVAVELEAEFDQQFESADQKQWRVLKHKKQQTRKRGCRNLSEKNHRRGVEDPVFIRGHSTFQRSGSMISSISRRRES